MSTIPNPDTRRLTLGLRARRMALSMTIEDLASELGYSYQTVWRWEHGRAAPLPDRVKALDALLNRLERRAEPYTGGLQLRHP